MKDNELRGVILQRIYELRHTQAEVIIPGHDMSLPDVPDHALGNICVQLAEKGLLEYKPHRSSETGQIDLGIARITGYGVDVMEGAAPPPVSILIDQSITVHSSAGVQIGERHIQGDSGTGRDNER